MRDDVHTKGIPVLCASCEARHRGICGALTPDQLVTLSKGASRRRIVGGRELVGDAENVDHYSNVLSGVVKLTKTLADGRQQIVGLQFAPDFLGRRIDVENRCLVDLAAYLYLDDALHIVAQLDQHRRVLLWRP